MATVIRVVAAVLAGGAILSACSLSPRAGAPPRSSPRDSVSSSSPSAPAVADRAPLRVVGLGDSVMAGTACGCRNLLQRYGDALAARTGRHVRADNLGANGAVTSDLLEDLRGDARTRNLVVRADVVVVVIGANDLVPRLDEWREGSCDDSCFRPSVQQMGRRLGQVLAAVQAARHGRTDHVLVTDYWNVFQDGQVARDTDGQAGVDWSTRVTAAANAEICRAAQLAGATCVDLVAPFKGLGERDPTPLLADDGDHPNAAGTRLIAHALIQATPDDL